MKVRLQVDVELSHVEGKFAGKDEVEEAIAEMVEAADEGMVSGVGADGDTTYEIEDWAVEVR